MNKKLFIFALLPTLLLGGCVTNNGKDNPPEPTPVDPGDNPSSEEGDKYDAWCNTFSKPNHLYFHYNRGDKKGYENFCLWLWQYAPQDLEGALWAFSGNPQVSTKLRLKPMSTSWMTFEDVGKGNEGSGVYSDNYGVIADVDLYKAGLVGGKSGMSTTYEGAKELGFLMVKQSSMDGSTNWTSDGGRENYISNFNLDSNWRAVTGGKAVHVFATTGSLDQTKYFAGSGIPTARVNPIEQDSTGKYSSSTDSHYPDSYKVPGTSDSFKDLGVGYQIFVASFRDSNGDGLGDLRGVIDSLDYLSDLGVEVLWLTPIQKSDSYHAYDISDYYAVDKKFGTIEDYRELIYKAHKKGMKVIMDLVLNHTSKGNVWFTNSQWGVNEDGTKNEWRDVYSWKYKDDPIEKYINGSYQTITVEQDALSDNPSWYRDGESNYYYYGKFGSGMPEINYQNAKTRQLVIDMAKYWMSFGLDGFRLDAVKHIFMRDECYEPAHDDYPGDIVITDTGTKRAYDDEKGEYIPKDFDYSSNLTKNVTWWKDFSNALKADYPNCFLVGENFDGWGKQTAAYYQGLDSQFSFSHYYHIPAYLYASSGGASTFASKQASESFDVYSTSNYVELDGKSMSVPGGHRPDFIDGAFTSNHDVMRAINQVNFSSGTVDGTTPSTKIDGSGDQINRAKIHAAVTLLNRGISWIYYGDELGMSSNTDQHIAKYGSENCEDIWYRQPFLWSNTALRPNYKSGQYTFELDEYNKLLPNMEEQASMDNSMLNFYKQVIEVKKMYPKDARITYHPTSGNHVMVIRVDDASYNPKLVIYINTGTSNSSYTMNPDYIAGANLTFKKSINGGPSDKDGDIGSTKFGISVFGLNN